MNRIVRKKNENYTIISNVCVRDNRLSLKAKGLISLVMSLPDDWDFSINGLCAITKEGKAAIYAAINELKDYGYCSIETTRDDKGRIVGNDYTFYEQPYAENQYTDYPHTENQDTDNPYTDNQDLENQTQIIKDINKEQIEISNDDKNKEKEDKSSSKKKSFIPPTLSEVQAYIKEKGYHTNAQSFIDYYEADDWYYGKGTNRKKVSSWKRCLATWENTYKQNHIEEYSEQTQEQLDEDRLLRQAYNDIPLRQEAEIYGIEDTYWWCELEDKHRDYWRVQYKQTMLDWIHSHNGQQ